MRAEGDQLEPLGPAFERAHDRGRHSDGVKRAELGRMAVQHHAPAPADHDIDLFVQGARWETGLLDGVKAKARGHVLDFAEILDREAHGPNPMLGGYRPAARV